MSAKQAATYHGADIVTRLRVQAPYSDDGQAMVEAAQEIESLRARHAFFRDRYSEAVRHINQEADIHAHCDISQASDE